MKRAFSVFAMIFALSVLAQAQTAAFNFQGRLNDGSSPANGRYDLQFLLFDAIAGGTQIGATVSKPNLMLMNGVFSTTLDFGAAAFSGGDRFLEIQLRPNGSPNAFVILGARQQMLSVPYAAKSFNASNADNAANAANAQQLGGIAPNGFIKNSDSPQIGSFNVNGSGAVGNLVVGGTGFFNLTRAHKGYFLDQDGVELRAFQPYISLIDSSLTSPNGNHQIQSANGAMYFYLNHASGSTDGAKMVIDTNGNVGIGVNAPTAKLEVAGTTKTGVLQITGGSDLAEKFDFSEPAQAGMVVAIDPDNIGKLTLARGAYNRRVAGIVSGANNLAAGMILPDLKAGSRVQPVALSGRVWVYADATKNPISAGDLLTTSETAGYAMKITDYKRAAGATIGKAMTELKTGKGLVLVLVSLQ